ncbi:nuclear transport factor 2 family protein [uncultured Roseobacter sp.]|uniref:YybH family protein n=1 Tax=uncultured Roseobacter sp. TaxID=114847 RepID=UPI0026146376|nr:nuclear transport factor 2 family protein [uncultured Roseobacter sp.]
MTPHAQITEGMNSWFAAWNIGTNAFDVEKLRPLFSTGEIHVVDNFDDKVVVLKSFDAYARTWTLSGFRSWSIAPIGKPQIRISGDLAVVTFVFVGHGPSTDGAKVSAAQHGTHVWVREGDGWRIVHEHLTTDTVESATKSLAYAT